MTMPETTDRPITPHLGAALPTRRPVRRSMTAVSLRDPTHPPAWMAALAMVLWIGTLHVFRTRSARGMAVGAIGYKRVMDASAAAAGRWLWRRWLNRRRVRGFALSDAVVAGPPADVRHVIHQIERRPGAAYRVAGVALDGSVTAADEAEASTASHHAPSFVGTHQIRSAVTRLRADAVIVAGPCPAASRTRTILRTGARVRCPRSRPPRPGVGGLRPARPLPPRTLVRHRRSTDPVAHRPSHEPA